MVDGSTEGGCCTAAPLLQQHGACHFFRRFRRVCIFSHELGRIRRFYFIWSLPRQIVLVSTLSWRSLVEYAAAGGMSAFQKSAVAAVMSDGYWLADTFRPVCHGIWRSLSVSQVAEVLLSHPTPQGKLA